MAATKKSIYWFIMLYLIGVVGVFAIWGLGKVVVMLLIYWTT